jgi:hypothetical protein
MYFPLLIVSFLSIYTCSAQNTEIIIPLNYDLNLKCKENKVYNLNEMDSILRKEMIKQIPEQYTNFALVKKTKEVGLYQIGCVNRSGFRSCTHSDETFLFFVHNGKVILYPNNLDQSEPIAYLKTMQEEEAISENDKEMFSKKIESITLLNTNQQKNKPKERW